mgnify:CR=1 FL=1
MCMHHEYQSGNYVEWNNLARQIISFIETNFPERFQYFIGGTNWGGNLHNMDLSDLPYYSRIRYSIHKYWFSDSEPYDEKWDYSFGDHKPVINVGEWGYMSEVKSETEWAERFVEYLRENDLRDTFFWTYSHNSGDTGGILLEASGSNAILYNYESGYLAFGTNSSERVRITSGGKVGIGSDAPDKILSMITDKTRLLILINPNNPTGSFVEKKDVDVLADGLKKYPHVTILSDEIYSCLLYTSPSPRD